MKRFSQVSLVALAVIFAPPIDTHAATLDEEISEIAAFFAWSRACRFEQNGSAVSTWLKYNLPEVRSPDVEEHLLQTVKTYDREISNMPTANVSETCEALGPVYFGLGWIAQPL